MTANAPADVLNADGSSVDVYKLATYALGSEQTLAAKVDADETEMASLEARVEKLESGEVSAASNSPVNFSNSTLASAFSGLGVFIQNGIAQFGTLVADQFVAATNSAGTSSAGSVTILAGNTVAQVTNAYVKPSSKIFVTFTASTTGSWYVSDKQSGSFRISLSEPQTNDVSFDYFLVQTEGQIATSSPEIATGNQQPATPAPVVISSDSSSTLSGDTSTSTSTPTSVSTSTPASTDTTPPAVSDVEPPTITLNGDAAIQINVGDTFTDPGATATDSANGNITSKIVETGSVDTTTAGLYTLTYTATDSAGNSASVSRVVTVIAVVTAPSPTSVSTSTTSSDSTDFIQTSSASDASSTPAGD